MAIRICLAPIRLSWTTDRVCSRYAAHLIYGEFFSNLCYLLLLFLVQSQLNIDDFSLESLDPLRKWARKDLFEVLITPLQQIFCLKQFFRFRFRLIFACYKNLKNTFASLNYKYCMCMCIIVYIILYWIIIMIIILYISIYIYILYYYGDRTMVRSYTPCTLFKRINCCCS